MPSLPKLALVALASLPLAVASAARADEPREPAPLEGASPAPPLAPSRTFARSGTLLLSVDDAFPVVALGGSAMLSTDRILRIGDTGNSVRTSPKPMSLDVAVADRVTLGGTLLVQGGLSSLAGASLRVGYALPLTDRLVLWPRLGVAYEHTLDDDAWTLASRTDVTLEARLAWTVTESWALTLGPTIAIPVQSGRPEVAYANALGTERVAGIARVDAGGGAAPRIGLAIGITGRIRDGHAGERESVAPEPRFFLGIERALPLLRYRVDSDAIDSRVGKRADGGTVDATSITPRSPSVAFDARIWKDLTVGAAASAGYVRVTQLTNGLVPPSSSPSTFAYEIAPRVGWRAPVAETFALWPRVGVTYVHASTASQYLDDLVAYNLGADVDAFAVFSPVRGVGFLFGPSVEVPITGAQTVVLPAAPGNVPGAPSTATTRRRDQAMFTAALTAGLVVELP